MKEHDIDIRKRIQLAAPVAAHRHQGHVFQQRISAIQVVDDGAEQLVVQLVHHVANQVGNLGSACAGIVAFLYFFAVIRQEVFAAGKIERAFFVKTGHSCVAHGIYVIGEIVINEELHYAPPRHFGELSLCYEWRVLGKRFLHSDSVIVKLPADVYFHIC